jgi:alkylation response protein AidB-like acyl-CoA dehydrogenase
MTTTVDEKSASVAERGMGFGLRQLNRLAGSDLLDRIRIRKQVERALFQGTKNGFRSATAAGRTFKAAQQLGKPARQKKSKSVGLFDLAPDDEQQMFQEAGRAFAAEKIRPAALKADDECATPKELLAETAELGVNMLGVPEELGGVMHEQSAVTNVLIGEALAQGDMGIAYAALAPGAVATAIGLWGSAEQEATYLPAFTGEDVPAAALAILEPRPLFDPLKLETTAKKKGDEWVLKGAKSLLARAKECELFLIAAEAEGIGLALFVVESGAKGLSVEDEPAMGLRPAATGRLLIDNVKVPAGALLGEGEGEGKAKDYADCVNRARIAWAGLATGTAQAVLDYVIPYVNDRQAFGEPISNRQGVAFVVSDIGIESDGIRLATYRAASRADRGEKFAREAAIARRLCATKGMEIGSQGVQLLGGHGFVKEHPVERWYRDLRAAGVMEGALLV